MRAEPLALVRTLHPLVKLCPDVAAVQLSLPVPALRLPTGELPAWPARAAPVRLVHSPAQPQVAPRARAEVSPLPRRRCRVGRRPKVRVRPGHQRGARGRPIVVQPWSSGSDGSHRQQKRGHEYDDPGCPKRAPKCIVLDHRLPTPPFNHRAHCRPRGGHQGGTATLPVFTPALQPTKRLRRPTVTP